MSTEVQPDLSSGLPISRVFWGSATSKTFRNIFSTNISQPFLKSNTTNSDGESSSRVNVIFRTVDQLVKNQFFRRTIHKLPSSCFILKEHNDNTHLDKFAQKKLTLKSFKFLENHGKFINHNFGSKINNCKLALSNGHVEDGETISKPEQARGQDNSQEPQTLHLEENLWEFGIQQLSPKEISGRSDQNLPIHTHASGDYDHQANIIKGRQNKSSWDTTPKLPTRKITTPKRLIVAEDEGEVTDECSLVPINVDNKSTTALVLAEDSPVVHKEEIGCQAPLSSENISIIRVFKEEPRVMTPNCENIVKKLLMGLLEEERRLMVPKEEIANLPIAFDDELEAENLLCLKLDKTPSSTRIIVDESVQNDYTKTLLVEGNTLEVLDEDPSPESYLSHFFEETLNRSDESDLNIGYIQIPDPFTLQEINATTMKYPRLKNSLNLMHDSKTISKNLPNRKRRFEIKIKKIPNFKNVLSPVSMYIKNSPKVPQIKRIHMKSIENCPLLRKIPTKLIPENKNQEENLPYRLYKPAKQKVIIKKFHKEFSKSIQKLIKNTPEIIKHQGRINKKELDPKDVEEMLLTEDLTAGYGVLNFSSSDDVSLLITTKAYIK